jgi:hypothetical protein
MTTISGMPDVLSEIYHELRSAYAIPARGSFQKSESESAEQAVEQAVAHPPAIGENPVETARNKKIKVRKKRIEHKRITIIFIAIFIFLLYVAKLSIVKTFCALMILLLAIWKKFEQ